MKSRWSCSLSVLLLAVLTATGCGAFKDGFREGSRPAEESSSALQGDPTTSLDAGSRASTSAAATATATATANSPAEPSPDGELGQAKLTGFGATVEDWEAEHGDSVEGYADGTVYGPVVRDGIHQYFGVIVEDLIYSYSRGFARGTDLRTAQRLVLQDFPADARIAVRDDDEASCLIVLVKSETVRFATKSDAIVAFFSEQDPDDDARTPLDRRDVANATVFASDEPGPDLGFC